MLHSIIIRIPIIIKLIIINTKCNPTKFQITHEKILLSSNIYISNSVWIHKYITLLLNYIYIFTI